MHPTDGFIGEESSVGEWMEVSVCGAVFSLNESRLTPCLSTNSSTTKKPSSTKSNVLRDGTLIDLCGATLLWRSVESLQKTPTKHYIEMNLENLNRLRPQCPVGLKTLMFPSTASPQAHQQLVQTCVLSKLNNLSRLNRQLLDRIPMVYLKCGHVHGQHDWGVKNDNERECPLCRTVGSYVQLLIGLEPSLYTDINDNNNNSNLFKPYAFRPCGHMASEKTCKYWSRIQVPQGTLQGLSAICPFCAVPLCKEKPYVKLIFQEGVHF
jgi:pellino protein